MQAICIRPFTDVRKSPEKRTSHSGKDVQQETQILFGETVTIEKEQDGWAYITCTDQKVYTDSWKGYSGWVEKEALSLKIFNPNYQVTKKCLQLQNNFVLPLGAKLYLEPTGDVFLAHMGKHTFTIQKDAVQKLSTQEIITLGCSMAGDPYLWGGMSAYHPECVGTGYDCSSLISILYRLHGISLPRNARDQFRLCREVAAHELQSFDLIFLQKEQSPYIDHVMLHLGNDMLLEATLISGTIRIISSIERLGKPIQELATGSFYNGNSVFLCKVS